MSWYISVHTEVIVKYIPSFAALSKSQWLQRILCMEWVNISSVPYKHNTTVVKVRRQHTTAPVDKAIYRKNVKWQQICTELLKKFKFQMAGVIVIEFKHTQLDNTPV
jgi:formate dehydrogenase maturation protein FdhE